MPQPIPVSGSAAIAVSPNPPAALSLLPKGTILAAQVISQLPQGLAQIQTSQGNFDIRTALALAVGAKLDLQLLRTGQQAQFQIRTIDGNAVANGRGGQPAASKARGVATPVIGSAPGTTVAGGQAIAGGASERIAVPNTGPGPVKLRAGSNIRVQYLDLAGKPRPAAAAAARSGLGRLSPHIDRSASGQSRSKGGAAPLEPGQSAAGNSRQTAERFHGTQNMPVAGQKPGMIVRARILTIARPGEPVQSVSPGASQAGISGTVVGSNLAGTPLVQTPGGTLSLNGAAPLPAGTKLLLDLKTTAVSGKPIVPQFILSNVTSSREWPSLEMALSQLRLSAPDLTQSFSQSRLPQANNRLAANILLYLSAVRGGDVRHWLGELARNLEQTQPNLAGRLREDFAQVARLFNDGPQSDWRTLIIPFMNGQGLDAVQMHMRGQSAGADGEDAEDASRFLVDIELSRLGRIQMDGLVKSQGKKFDLIFRTEKPLPAYMRKDISRIFHDFAELGGITGGLTFQASARFINVPIDYIDGQLRSGLVV